MGNIPTKNAYFIFKVKHRAEFSDEYAFITYLTEYVKTTYLYDTIFFNERITTPVNPKYQKFILGNRLSYVQYPSDKLESLFFLFFLIDRTNFFGEEVFSSSSVENILTSLFKVLGVISNREIGNDEKFYNIENITDKEIRRMCEEYLLKYKVKKLYCEECDDIIVYNGKEKIAENYTQSIKVYVSGKRCVNIIRKIINNLK